MREAEEDILVGLKKKLMMMSESYHFCSLCKQYDDNDEPWPGLDGSQ